MCKKADHVGIIFLDLTVSERARVFDVLGDELQGLRLIARELIGPFGGATLEIIRRHGAHF